MKVGMKERQAHLSLHEVGEILQSSFPQQVVCRRERWLPKWYNLNKLLVPWGLRGPAGRRHLDWEKAEEVKADKVIFFALAFKATSDCKTFSLCCQLLFPKLSLHRKRLESFPLSFSLSPFLMKAQFRSDIALKGLLSKFMRPTGTDHSFQKLRVSQQITVKWTIQCSSKCSFVLGSSITQSCTVFKHHQKRSQLLTRCWPQFCF